ncbi:MULTISPECIES: LEA type 2 family protein [Halobacterium]|uniref:LEA type 2 family protein n=1 Tax=Halobacterium TaxID=2239 RepID=UPI00073E3668|nr:MULTISPECIES: LEA type 2 family protein [Halobacterium]MCG1002640.1 LEA type 2 family protein [Halobacterium noricense]
MNVRALLFGSTIRVAVTVVAGLGLVVGGAFVGGFVGVPSVEQIDNEFGAVNETQTEIRTDLVIHNPNPVGVRLGGTSVNYTVAMNDIRMASGDKRGVGVGTGNSTVNLTTYLHNERIPAWWVSHIRGGEQTNLTVSATVNPGFVGQSASFKPAAETIETDLLGQFNSTEDRPVNAGSPLVEDPVLIVQRTNASWGTVTDAETPINLEFEVYNPKLSPVVVSNIGYDISMNDVAVGSGETENAESIPGRSARVVETPTVIDNQNLDEWWVTHIDNNQTTDLRIEFYAELDVPGSEEPIRVPLDELTYTQTIETDMFGSKSAPNGTDGDSDGNQTTTDGTTTDSTTTTGTTTSGDGTTTSDTTTTDGSSTTTSGDSTTADDSTTTDGGLLARGSQPA